MGGKSSPPPPDYGPVAAASQRATEVSEGLGNRQIDFAERQYAEMKPLAERVAASHIAAQDQQMRQAQEYYDYNVGTFRPLEQGLVADATRFSTEGYREQQAREAAAATGRAFGVAQDAASRAAASRGVNPNSGAGMALQSQGMLGLAAGRANAMTGARNRAEQLGFARRLDVTGLGRNLAGASIAAYSGATGAGSAGLNSAMSAGNQYSLAFGQGAGTVMGGAQLGLQGATSVMNAQTSAYNAGMAQADPFASIIGMGLGGWAGGGFKTSDIRLKQNIERVGFDERTQLPIYEFEYKANPGERFRGVMAHEVEVNFPDAVVTRPDGYKAVFYERLGMQMVKV